MAQLVVDTFTGAAGTPLETYNPAWVKGAGLSGGMQIASGGDRAAYILGSGTCWFYRSDIVPPSADYTVGGDVYIASTTSGKNVVFVGRMASASQTGYGVRVQTGAGISLLRYNNGSTTVIGTAGFSFTTGATVNVKLAMSGSSLSVYINDVLSLGPITDTSITDAGYVGMAAVTSTGTQLQVDNFTLTTADAGAGATTTDVSPVPAALALTGYAPSITRSANQAVSPAPAALAVRGYAPSVTQTASKSISPAAASLVVRGYAPAISRSANQKVTPAPAALIVRGYAPAIMQSGPRVVSPAPGALVLRGHAPTISQAANNVPQTYAAAFMRASSTSRSVALGLALHRSVVLSAPMYAGTTMLRAATLNRSTGLSAGAVNRTGSFP